MMHRILFVMVLSLALGSCVNSGYRFDGLSSTKSDSSLVYFYRPRALLDGLAAPTIQVNGIDAFKLKNGRYHAEYLPPGKHRLTVKAGSVLSDWNAEEMSVEFNFVANQRYFFRLTADIQDVSTVAGFTTVYGAYAFGMVHESTALRELPNTKRH